MASLTIIDISEVKEAIKTVDELVSENYEEILREIELREDVVFLSPPDRVSLAIGLYLNVPKVLELFGIERSRDLSDKPSDKMTLRDKMTWILEKFISSYKQYEGKTIKEERLSYITIGEVFKLLSYLRDISSLHMWCVRRELLRILKASSAEKKAKRYGRHGQTDVYKYLGYLERLLSSFNMVTSFNFGSWMSQILEERKPYQMKMLRITLPGTLLLSVYARYALGGLTDPELRLELENIVILPKFVIDYVRAKLNNVGEITILPLARLVAEEMENRIGINVMTYLPLLTNDIINLLLLYERNRVDIDALHERGLVRWRA
jgi:hypothetical protein